MNRLQKGVVLLSTMLMLVVMTLLVLSMMQSVLLYMKASNQLFHQHTVFYDMEDVINRLDVASSNCVVNNQNPNQLIDLLVANQGCTHEENRRKYTYIIGDLSLYPCFQIKTASGMRGSRHWLITIASTGLPHVVLQVRIAEPTETEPCLLTVVHPIHAGVLSWRRITFLTINDVSTG